MTRPIDRRSLLQLVAAAPLAFAAPRPRPRPNVVLIVADDQGYADLSSYGARDIRSPHIDSIGRNGVRFEQFYANAPECTPTRAALLTGRYQHRVGGLECAIGVGNVGRYDEAEWLANRGELGLPHSETTLPRLLKDAGYDTACFGKWHLGYPAKFSPNGHGFDEYLGIMGGNSDYFNHREEGGAEVLYRNGKPLDRKGRYLTDLFAEEAVAWLARRSPAKPFFLYLPFNAPHTPIQDPDAYDPAAGTAPRRQGHRPTYAKMVERMDARVGDVLAQLRRMGAAENTLVIYHSDNGGDPNGDNGPLRGRKSSCWEGGIRVPCLIQWPGRLPAGRAHAHPAITMDLAPTILAAAGVAPPRPFDGIDLLPALTGRSRPAPRTLFWRYKRAKDVRKAVRDGDWKLVADNGKEELHDLARDAGEQHDLLAARPEDAARLRAKLAAWEREVAAPRLKDFPRS